MPECLCYIFHKMTDHVHKLQGVVHSDPSVGCIYSLSHGDESFLKEVITPLYEVMLKEVKRNKGGKTSHSAWRNYDDLNEYFCSRKCLDLDWPFQPKKAGAEFFVHANEKEPPNLVLHNKPLLLFELERGSPKQILLKYGHFGITIEVSTECGFLYIGFSSLYEYNS